MKDRRPQFVKMNAMREENPPLREVGCPDYRRCLSEAAYNNFCLDCSQCAADALPQAPAIPIRLKSAPAAAACRG